MHGPIGDLMQQAQKMQENMRRAQEELARLEVVGSAGGGMVTVTLNGRHEARRVKIDKTLLGDDLEMLEDLLVAAINDATNKLGEAAAKKMAEVTSGLTLPLGFKLPF